MDIRKGAEMNSLITAPGSRLIFVRGYEGADRYPTIRDTEIPLFDEEDDYVYIKKTDSNNYSTIQRFKLTEDPVPKFEPDRYVTVDKFESLRKEMLDGFKSIQESIAVTSKQSAGHIEA